MKLGLLCSKLNTNGNTDHTDTLEFTLVCIECAVLLYLYAVDVQCFLYLYASSVVLVVIIVFKCVYPLVDVCVRERLVCIELA
jgi:hypothetical protein